MPLLSCRKLGVEDIKARGIVERRESQKKSLTFSQRPGRIWKTKDHLPENPTGSLESITIMIQMRRDFPTRKRKYVSVSFCCPVQDLVGCSLGQKQWSL